MDVDTRREFLREMREQVTRLTKLASDLLDLSRLDAGAFDVAREPVDLGSTARGLVREFRGLAAGHGSRVALVRGEGELPHAIADEQRVRQIGRALVDNAIRHNPRGTEVRVAVGAHDGVVRLTVGDDGPGIDADTAAAHVRAVLPRRDVLGRGQRARAWPSPASWRSAWAARWSCGRGTARRPSRSAFRPNRCPILCSPDRLGCYRLARQCTV